MLMADTVKIFLIVLGSLLSLCAFWLFCRALWPSLVKKSQSHCQEKALKCFFLGLPISAVPIIAFLILVNLPQPILKIIGFAIFFLYLVYANIGVAGLVTMMGERLREGTSPASPWGTTLLGSLVLSFTSLLPLFGWFFIFPIALITGAGARFLAGKKSSNSSADSDKIKTSDEENDENIPT